MISDAAPAPGFEPPAADTELIVCRSTPWYHKRRIAMLLLVFGFSIAFFYDWKIRYPKHQEAQAENRRLVAESGETDGTAAYAKIAEGKGWPAKPDLNKDYDYAIKEQLFFGILTAVCGAVMLYFYIRTTRGALSADADSFTTADGRRVPFAIAFRIDRRKWQHKGLAYVFYRDGAGKEKRAVIDDLIFGGAVRVLDRLSANFKGEVIDLAKTPEPDSDKKEPEESAGATPVEQQPEVAAADDSPR
jgi:hypothetical protein